MRKIDFTTKLKDLKGSNIVEKTVNNDGTINESDLTLSSVAVNALLVVPQNEQNVSGAIKLQRYKLASKIMNNSEATLASSEVTSLKDLIGTQYGPLVVGQAWNLLDPDSNGN